MRVESGFLFVDLKNELPLACSKRLCRAPRGQPQGARSVHGQWPSFPLTCGNLCPGRSGLSAWPRHERFAVSAPGQLPHCLQVNKVSGHNAMISNISWAPFALHIWGGLVHQFPRNGLLRVGSAELVGARWCVLITLE